MQGADPSMSNGQSCSDRCRLVTYEGERPTEEGGSTGRRLLLLVTCLFPLFFGAVARSNCRCNPKCRIEMRRGSHYRWSCGCTSSVTKSGFKRATSSRLRGATIRCWKKTSSGGKKSRCFPTPSGSQGRAQEGRGILRRDGVVSRKGEGMVISGGPQ